MKSATPKSDLCKFGFFRLSKGKTAVDVCPNPLRGYHSQELPVYKVGRSIFVNYREFESFIRDHHELDSKVQRNPQ